MELKVIHGMSEVAGQGINSVTGLRNNNVTSNMVVWSRNPSGYEVDIDLKIKKDILKMPFYGFKMFCFCIKAWTKYNVLHSHFGYSLLPFGLDLKVDKLLGMKVFAEFHGSDIRWAYKEKEYKYLENYTITVNKQKRQKRLNRLIINADGIILHDYELIEHLPNISKPVYIVPLRIDIKKFEPIYSLHRSKPIIVHAPSKRKIKGTDRILEALKKVKCDYELILVEGKTQQEAFEIYKKADIIIDQISGGTYGVLALEAMALGKPVITYIAEEYRSTFPNELPIVSAEFDDLHEIVSDLLADSNKRTLIGKAGRKYVERYHDADKVAYYLKKIYEGTIEDNNLFNLL